MPDTCLCPSTGHGLSITSGPYAIIPQMKQKVKKDKELPSPQISFLPAPEVTNLTQNSRKQLSIEQDGEEQGGNCSLLKHSCSRAWGALEQHSRTFLPTQENNTADFQKITRAIA